jgi:hypothetical protein
VSAGFDLFGLANQSHDLAMRSSFSMFQSYSFPHSEGLSMSHIVQVQTEVRDPIAIQAACGRLSLANAVHQETKLFSSSVIGWAVQLPRPRLPLTTLADIGANRGISTDFYKVMQSRSRRAHSALPETVLLDCVGSLPAISAR